VPILHTKNYLSLRRVEGKRKPGIGRFSYLIHMPHDNQSRENPTRDKVRTGGPRGYQQIFTEGPGRRYPTSYTTLLLRFPVDNNTATNMFGGRKYLSSSFLQSTPNKRHSATPTHRRGAGGSKRGSHPDGSEDHRGIHPVVPV
jgi:hypothetical protein